MKISRLLLGAMLLLLASCTADFDEAVSVETKEVNEIFSRKDIAHNAMTVKFSSEVADALSVEKTRSGELTPGNVTLDEICRE